MPHWRASLLVPIPKTCCCGGRIDNRPFLRCMHGYGLCLWRLGHFDEAESIFDRMLWLNPSDKQGVRFLIDELRTGTAWEDRQNDLTNEPLSLRGRNGPEDLERHSPLGLAGRRRQDVSRDSLR
ncbi:hypothetical protein MYX78_10205 [Acidobacteria bacterium AH-259-G07]|nr:hypothetical protein [Acidobacteria bacterium AH-259-G07]